MKEHIGPRITVQDILNVSRDPNINYLWITRSEGLSRFRGWFPMITGFPMTKENYVALQRTPWPDEDARTITVESHPELTHPASGFSDEQANEMLKRLKRPTRGPFP